MMAPVAPPASFRRRVVDGDFIGGAQARSPFAANNGSSHGLTNHSKGASRRPVTNWVTRMSGPAAHLFLQAIVLFHNLVVADSSLRNSWFNRDSTSNGTGFGFGFLLLITNLLYYLTWSTDPGYLRVDTTALPINLNLEMQTIQPDGIDVLPDEHRVNEADEVVLLLGSNAASRSAATHGSVALMTQDERERNPNVYCWICDMSKPPRSKHCFECQACVYRWDHHCPYFSACIGGNNHVYFWWFLLVESIVILWSMSMAFSSKLLDTTLTVYILHFLVLVILSTLAVSTSILFGFHSWLCSNNITTYQMILAQRTPGSGIEGSAFDKGFVENIRSFCLRDYPVNWRLATRRRVMAARGPEVILDTFETDLVEEPVPGVDSKEEHLADLI